MNKKALYITLLFGFLGSGILTLTPDESASKVCYLGYKAHCSFTPFGTIILFVATLVILILLKKSTKEEAS